MHINKEKKPAVFLICTGLGNINRGYETFTRECFDALKDNASFNLYLLKGAGKNINKEIKIPNLARKKKAALIIGKLLKKQPYVLEQFSFAIFLLPLIIKKKASLIYYSDFILGTYLWHIRKMFKLNYRLLFANGAPNGAPFNTEDHIQQLLPVHLQNAIQKGEPVSKQTLLPYGFNINLNEQINVLENRKNLREQFGFTSKQKIVLSVGAVNKQHKRMDYVINEFALLDKHFFLIILGQFEDETAELLNLAETKITGRYYIKNIPFSEVKKYYTVADYFVLASISEGFGRVLIEALSYGLPCIVHDYVITHQVLQQYGVFIDMRLNGALSNCLNEISDQTFSKPELINAAYNLYSWDVLKDNYANMILKQINN